MDDPVRPDGTYGARPRRRREDRWREEADEQRRSDPGEPTGVHVTPPVERIRREASAFDPHWKRMAKRHGPLLAFIAAVGAAATVLSNAHDWIDRYIVSQSEDAPVMRARDTRLTKVEYDLGELRERTTKMDAKLDRILERLPARAP